MSTRKQRSEASAARLTLEYLLSFHPASPRMISLLPWKELATAYHYSKCASFRLVLEGEAIRETGNLDVLLCQRPRPARTTATPTREGFLTDAK